MKYRYNAETGMLQVDVLAWPRTYGEVIREGHLWIASPHEYVLEDGRLWVYPLEPKTGKITVHGKRGDFSSNGIAVLDPTACTIHEEAGGTYELELEHPMDAGGKWREIMVERVIKAPVPARLTPEYDIYTPTQRKVYEVSASKAVLYAYIPYNETRTYYTWSFQNFGAPGSDVDWLWVPDPKQKQVSHSSPIETLSEGTRLTWLRDEGSWAWVVSPSGNTGVVAKSALGETYETIDGEPTDRLQARTIRDQLFRVYRTTIDTTARKIKAYARHIYYDQLGEVITYLYLQGASWQYGLNQIAGVPPGISPFKYYVEAAPGDDIFTEEYTGKNVVEAQLDPDTGVLPRSGKQMLWDNYNVYYMAPNEQAKGRLEYGHNLIGVTLDYSLDDVVNRIIPYGKDADDNLLYLPGWLVDAEGDAETIIRGRAITYDVKTGENDLETDEEARQKLIELAMEDLEEMAQPSVEMTVNLLLLGDTLEYAEYRDLDRLYLYDVVTIQDTAHGIDVEAMITEYDYDALAERYISIKIGSTTGARAWHNIVY